MQGVCIVVDLDCIVPHQLVRSAGESVEAALDSWVLNVCHSRKNVVLHGKQVVEQIDDLEDHLHEEEGLLVKEVGVLAFHHLAEDVASCLKVSVVHTYLFIIINF